MDGKSILGILLLAAAQGTELDLAATARTRPAIEAS
jgi:phosphotransferase system HPr-like phosphotransfer protein